MAADDVIDLNTFILEKLPPTIYYIPEFITEEEEKALWKSVYDAPKPKWTRLLNRRLQNWGGLPHPKGMIAEKMPQWLGTYCDKIALLGVFQDKTPNHVLVNEYLPGQGIMPHTDGPLYYPVVSNITLGSHSVLDFYHSISSDADNISSTGDTMAEGHQVEKKEDGNREISLEERYIGSVLLEPRSLVLTMNDMYENYLHGIADVKKDQINEKMANLHLTSAVQGEEKDRNTRISLTIRFVPKVLKTKIKLGR
ncbi:alpha-ketoglutarate-dependent dioxygenase alkB homolog 6 [Lingula anatina]|uniref:Alpha-ketoglutarate-dependent dioxygenase alkB homolog 6 n=1 Tax=Lingula anatina TaxID=7574 RepID=A0A1S3H9B1_LINAN|nr:alpha-ketoglutarate-dependent dioxygenase alkB homolog 6 [Lingula anatina]|eukprot:XP_013382587.1 alpha-ketoglutarate-dependent dioxygenase alkB homolog 6 [Lingula anatina]